MMSHSQTLKKCDLEESLSKGKRIVFPSKFFKKMVSSTCKYKPKETSRQKIRHVPLLKKPSIHGQLLKIQREYPNEKVQQSCCTFLKQIHSPRKTEGDEYWTQIENKKRNQYSQKQDRLMSNFQSCSYFQPKKYKQIIRKHTEETSQRRNKKPLSKISSKCKVQKCNKQNLFYQQNKYFNRYSYQELHSFFRVLMKQTKGQYDKFKKCMVVVLNLAGIIIEQSEFQQIISKYPVITDFNTFAEVYKEFEKHHFRQAIYDSLNILFHNYLKTRIYVPNLKSIFKERIKAKQAQLLHDCFIEKIEQHFGPHQMYVKIEDLYHICYHEVTLCQKIYEYYIKGIKEGNNKNAKMFMNPYNI